MRQRKYLLLLRFAECDALENEDLVCDGDCVSDSDGNCNQIRKLYVVRYGDKNGDSESVSIRQQRRVPTFIANERCELNDSSEYESIPADAVSHIFCERVIGRVSDNGRRWLALQLG
jgi:hypothetical protein